MKIESDKELSDLIGGRCEPTSPTWLQAKDFFLAVNKEGSMPDQSNPHYSGLDRCWDWDGKVMNGYATLMTNGNQRGAHRFSYSFFNGEIPKGMVIMHKCDNKICTNPKHLEVGTHQQNIQDAHKRGLVKNGRLNGAAMKANELPYLVMTAVVNSLNKHILQMADDDMMERAFGMNDFHEDLKSLLSDCFAIAFPDRKFLRPKRAKKRIEAIQPFPTEREEYPMLEYWLQEIDDERRY